MASTSKSFYNKIFIHDCREMVELPDEEVDLMITSPPYNVTKEYDENLTLKQYLQLLMDVLKETYRVLRPNGIIALNIANVGRKPYIPLDCHVIEILLDLNCTIIQ
jgi:site-specific DNA-methyltransferase (adenine-specific)